MRIRSTKPEFWRSKTIAALPWDVRLVLKGLESYVDDNGVGKDDIALIAADVFSRDLVANPRDTLARLSEAISDLATGGLIVRYEYDDEDLIYIDHWKKLQRIDKPARGRFRRPDGTLEYSEEVDRESYRSPRETVASPPEDFAPGTGEQGSRGTGEEGSSDEADASSGDAPSRTLAVVNEDRPDVDRLCNHLADRIEANGANRPNITGKWRDAARLMLDRDGRTEEDVHLCIKWCQADEFWRSNILSMPKLREKFDQLRMQAQRSTRPASRQQETDGLFDRAMQRARTQGGSQ